MVHALSKAVVGFMWCPPDIRSGIIAVPLAGRPVDILIMPDGAMLVSDDYGGAITRIAYVG